MLCAFFLGLCANAQPTVTVYRPTQRVTELKTDGTKYMIFNTTRLQGDRWGFVLNTGSGLDKPKAEPSTMSTVNNAYLFTIEATGTANCYYIKSVSSNTYVNYQGSTNNETPQECYIYKWSEAPYKNTEVTSMSKDDETQFIASADLTDEDGVFTISNNTGGDYSCWNGNVGGFATWSNAHPYAFYEVSETEEEGVTTTMIDELASLSNDKVYIIKNARKENTALVYNPGAPQQVSWNGKVTSIDYDPRSENFYWAIYKSAANKYYLYNVGGGKYMGSAMVKDAAIPLVDAAGLHSIVIEKSTGDANYPFMLSANSKKGAINTTGNHHNGAINWRDGYSHTNDPGNQFAIYEVADLAEAVKTQIESDVAAYEANGVANWKALYADVFGYVGGYPLNLQETFNAIASEEAKDNFLFSNNTIALADGYYFVKGTGSGNDVNWYLTHKEQNEKNSLWAEQPALLNANCIWKFESVENGYKLQSVNLKQYFQLKTATNGGDNNTYITESKENGNLMKFTDNGSGKFTIKNAGNNIMRTENNGQVNNWNTESGETWYLIPATELDINMVAAQGGAYTSIYLPFAVTLDEGTKAYAGEVSDAKDVLNMTEVGNVVPAETPVVLVSDNAGAHTLTIGGTADAVANNDLAGTLTPIVFADNKADYLIFGIASEKAGFYTSAGTQISANKAYLPASLVAAAQTVKMNFGGEATGIEAIEKADNAKAPIYDLSGRRVVNTAKGGIYIQNGRKFIVK